MSFSDLSLCGRHGWGNTLDGDLIALLLPVQVTPAAAASTLAAVASPLFAIFAAVFVPLAMILFGVNLSALSIAFKWAVAGHVVPGVHKCAPLSCAAFSHSCRFLSA